MCLEEVVDENLLHVGSLSILISLLHGGVIKSSLAKVLVKWVELADNCWPVRYLTIEGVMLSWGCTSLLRSKDVSVVLVAILVAIHYKG